MAHTCLPDTEHLDLRTGWADLRTRLTHGQTNVINRAIMVADYGTRGALEATVATVKGALMDTPQAWQKLHLDDTVGVVRDALTMFESALSASIDTLESRRNQAQAGADMLDAYGQTFVAAWEVTDLDGNSLPLEPRSWAELHPADAQAIHDKARSLWTAWRREVMGPLDPEETDDVGSDSSPAERPRKSRTTRS